MKTTELYVFDFFSTYSGDCADLKPTVKKAEQRFAGRVKVIHIDVNNPKNKAFVEGVGVQAVPTFLVVNPAGEQLKKLSGSEQGNVLLILLQTLLPEAGASRNEETAEPQTMSSSFTLTPEIAHADPGN